MNGHLVLWRAEFERPVERRRKPRPETPREPKRARRRIAAPAAFALALLAAAPLLRAVWLGMV